MKKEVIRTSVPDLGVPLNLGVRYGELLFVSGIPPFTADFAEKLRDARAGKAPMPQFPDIPFEEQARLVMDYVKEVVEAAGSTMDHLLKVNVWLRNQTDATVFDRVYRAYFSSIESMPARTRLQAGETPMGCGLEVEAIGYIPKAG